MIPLQSWGSIKEALIKSDFVAIRRCSQKIPPYISTICCVTVKVTMSVFFARASSGLELELNQSFLNLQTNANLR